MRLSKTTETLTTPYSPYGAKHAKLAYARSARLHTWIILYKISRGITFSKLRKI